NDITNQSQLYPRTKSIEINIPSKINNDIVINEFLADNITINTDPAGEYDDWIELYNPSSDSILLTGRYLTDKPDNLTKWQFTQPDLYLHAGEFLIIWCDEDQEQEGIHTNFKLSSDGEFIALTSTDGISVIDSITFGLQLTDVSYGRYPDAENNWDYLSPSPGTGNILSDVKNEFIPKDFSLTAYPNPFNPSTTIRYQIPELNNVHIEIFDLLGKRIWFKNMGEQQAGKYEIHWNGTNQNGVNVSSGMYLLRIESGTLNQNYKLMLIK
ncbi:MAG: lamin tail domain-containing protein, partial [Ignavibacteriaceae bacterium]